MVQLRAVPLERPGELSPLGVEFFARAYPREMPGGRSALGPRQLGEFTDRGPTRNLEAGVLIEDTTFARRLSEQWLALVDSGQMTPYRQPVSGATRVARNPTPVAYG